MQTSKSLAEVRPAAAIAVCTLDLPVLRNYTLVAVRTTWQVNGQLQSFLCAVIGVADSVTRHLSKQRLFRCQQQVVNNSYLRQRQSTYLLNGAGGHL